MKTRDSLRYFVNDCRLMLIKLYYIKPRNKYCVSCKKNIVKKNSSARIILFYDNNDSNSDNNNNNNNNNNNTFSFLKP